MCCDGTKKIIEVRPRSGSRKYYGSEGFYNRNN